MVNGNGFRIKDGVGDAEDWFPVLLVLSARIVTNCRLAAGDEIA